MVIIFVFNWSRNTLVVKKTDPSGMSIKLTSDIKSVSDKTSQSKGGDIVVKTSDAPPRLIVNNSERVLGNSNNFFVNSDNDHYLGSTRRALNGNSKNDFDFSQNFNDLSEIP
jgi:hypothetical protein